MGNKDEGAAVSNERQKHKLDLHSELISLAFWDDASRDAPIFLVEHDSHPVIMSLDVQ